VVPDFVEGMVYTPSTGVMMTGVYASSSEAKKKGNRINRVGAVVQALVLPVRRASSPSPAEGVVPGGVHSDAGVLPPAHSVPVLLVYFISLSRCECHD
jgi:hypothetical protein